MAHGLRQCPCPWMVTDWAPDLLSWEGALQTVCSTAQGGARVSLCAPPGGGVPQCYTEETLLSGLDCELLVSVELGHLYLAQVSFFLRNAE